jgi:hypothetical protein
MTKILVSNQDKSVVKEATNSIQARSMARHLAAVFNEEFEVGLDLTVEEKSTMVCTWALTFRRT